MFFVGGPNQRKDFHIEEGEELFYMKKGAMELIIQEQGTFKTVTIQEGEVSGIILCVLLFCPCIYLFEGIFTTRKDSAFTPEER